MSATSKPYGALREHVNGARTFTPDVDEWEDGQPSLENLWPGDIVVTPTTPQYRWVVTSDLTFRLL